MRLRLSNSRKTEGAISIDAKCRYRLPRSFVDSFTSYIYTIYTVPCSTVWEHPDQLGINSIIDSAPACVYEALESTGVTTMHHYFWDYPLLILCPLQHQQTVQGYRKLMSSILDK